MCLAAVSMRLFFCFWIIFPVSINVLQDRFCCASKGYYITFSINLDLDHSVAEMLFQFGLHVLVAICLEFRASEIVLHPADKLTDRDLFIIIFIEDVHYFQKSIDFFHLLVCQVLFFFTSV